MSRGGAVTGRLDLDLGAGIVTLVPLVDVSGHRDQVKGAVALT